MHQVVGAPVRLVLGRPRPDRVHRPQRVGDHGPAQRGRAALGAGADGEDHPG
ncbi:hypothetical protein ACFQZ4_38995 [Catellatospora coxensis]